MASGNLESGEKAEYGKQFACAIRSILLVFFLLLLCFFDRDAHCAGMLTIESHL